MYVASYHEEKYQDEWQEDDNDLTDMHSPEYHIKQKSPSIHECPSCQYLFHGYCLEMNIPQELIMMIINFVHSNFIWIKLLLVNIKTGNID